MLANPQSLQGLAWSLFVELSSDYSLTIKSSELLVATRSAKSTSNLTIGASQHYSQSPRAPLF